MVRQVGGLVQAVPQSEDQRSQVGSGAVVGHLGDVNEVVYAFGVVDVDYHQVQRGLLLAVLLRVAQLQQPFLTVVYPAVRCEHQRPEAVHGVGVPAGGGEHQPDECVPVGDGIQETYGYLGHLELAFGVAFDRFAVCPQDRFVQCVGRAGVSY